MKATEISIKYANAQYNFLQDKKKDMAQDITEYGDYRVNKALRLLAQILFEEQGIKFSNSIANRVKKVR